MTMPRTLQQILDQQEELGRQFENYEPDPADERDPEPYRNLMTAAMARGDAESAVQRAVHDARDAGYSWTAIGSVLGTSGAAAQQRYRQLVDR